MCSHFVTLIRLNYIFANSYQHKMIGHEWRYSFMNEWSLSRRKFAKLYIIYHNLSKHDRSYTWNNNFIIFMNYWSCGWKSVWEIPCHYLTSSVLKISRLLELSGCVWLEGLMYKIRIQNGYKITFQNLLKLWKVFISLVALYQISYL